MTPPTEELESRLEVCVSLVQDLRDEVEDNEDQIKELRAENEALRRELDQVKDRTDLLQQVRRASSRPKEEKVAVTLTVLRQRAERQGGSASMQWDGVVNALGGDIDRTTSYDIMQAAADMIDSDAVRYVKEPRSSKQNTRLVMDLNAGRLPHTIAGHDITGQGEA